MLGVLLPTIRGNVFNSTFQAWLAWVYWASISWISVSDGQSQVELISLAALLLPSDRSTLIYYDATQATVGKQLVINTVGGPLVITTITLLMGTYQRRLEGSWHHVRTDQFSLEFLLSQCYFCLVSSINY